jgi:3-methyladenine DNA glycosylase/8-oxoguanine DNA glycosylase
MILNRTNTVEIIPSAPFAFDPTFHKPDHFTSGDNLWEPGIRWQTLNWQGVPVGIKFASEGTVNEPKISMALFSEAQLPGGFIDSLTREIRYRYNLDLDLDDFYKGSQRDALLAPIIERLRGMRPGHSVSLYEYLIIGIVLQNAPVRRSVRMFQVLLENYGTPLEFDGKELWCFWNPGGLQGVSEEELRTLKIGYRARFIKRIDDYFAQGLINEEELRKQERETQMEELLKLYGVGPATVWYLLFDVFHHWDFFNHISPWEQKIYSKLFFNKEPEDPVPVDKLLKYFDRYGKYKQLAVHYIWEDLFWRREREHIPWLEKEIRI